MEEKRRAKRFSLDIPVKSTSLNSNVPNSVTNISTNGLFISTTKPLPEDKTLLLEFKLPNDKVTLKVQGKVAWSRSKGDNPGMGVEFTNLTENQFDILLEYLESLYA